MEWLLCVDAFAAEPAVKAVKMGFAPVIVSPGDGLGDSVGWDHKGAFCFIVVFPEDRHHFGIHLDFSYRIDRKSTRLNSSHQIISYAVFCLKKKKKSQKCVSSQNPGC